MGEAGPPDAYRYTRAPWRRPPPGHEHEHSPAPAGPPDPQHPADRAQHALAAPRAEPPPRWPAAGPWTSSALSELRRQGLQDRLGLRREPVIRDRVQHSWRDQAESVPQ